MGINSGFKGLITQYFLRHFSHDSIPEKSVMLSGLLVCCLTIIRHNVCMGVILDSHIYAMAI